jgi:DHA1 family tetracycline resistance protein-like MFS transporter
MQSHKKISFSILLLVAFIDYMGIGLVYPMFSSMLFNSELHFFPSQTSEAVRGMWLGLLLSMGPLAQFLSAPIIGTLSDQLGRKVLLKRTLLMVIFGYCCAALAVWYQNLYLLLLGRIIVGAGSGNAAVVNAAVSDISDPETKAKNFGLINMAFGVGFTIGPFMGGLLSRIWGYNSSFIFALLLTLLNLILLIAFFAETHHLRKKVQLSFDLGFKHLKRAFQLPTIRILLLCLFVMSVGWSFYWEFIPVTWIKRYGLGLTQISNFYAYGAGFYALSCGVLIRPIIDKFAPKRVFFVGLIGMAIFLFPLLATERVNWFWLFVPFQQFFIALIFPVGTSIISNAVKEDEQGEVMGILQSTQAFAFAASPLFAGALIGISFNMPIIIGSTCTVLSALIFCLCTRNLFSK